MTDTQLPYIPRRDDPLAALVVEKNVEFLRDKFDDYTDSFEQGTAAVITGNTSVTVTHNLGAATYRVMIVPTVDPTLRFWVSNKTDNDFQINLSAAAPVGGVSFDWVVKED